MAAPQKRVLIAEDEKPLAHALELKLKFEGYDVVVAHDGQKCIELLTGQQFDVLLLDIMMPVMGGFQVLEQLQKAQNPPIVFVLSNLSQPEDEERALGMGAKKFFVKADTPLSIIIEEIKKV